MNFTVDNLASVHSALRSVLGELVEAKESVSRLERELGNARNQLESRLLRWAEIRREMDQVESDLTGVASPLNLSAKADELVGRGGR